MRMYGTHRVTPVYGDYKPVERRRNNVRLAGWDWSEKTGEAMEWNSTYNDVVDGVITGRSEQAVTVQGKNLFGGTWEVGTISATTGADAASSTRIRSSFFRAPENQAVVKSCADGFVVSNLYFYDESKNYLSFTAASSATTPEGTAYCRQIAVFDSAVGDIGYYSENIKYQIEFGSSATDYEPFVPDSPSLDYPSPILSAGDCDLISTDGVAVSAIALPPLRAVGDVTDTLAYMGGGLWEYTQRLNVLVLTGTEAWDRYLYVNRLRILDMMGQADQAVAAPLLCTHFKPDAYVPILSYDGDDAIAGRQAISSGIAIRYNHGAPLLEFTAMLAAQYAAGTPVTVLYQRATPVTTQLALGQLSVFPRHTEVYQDTDGLKAFLALRARASI